jgi:hypothetical protein
VRVSAIETSANLFELLGVSPQLGRVSAGRPVLLARTIAVISDRLWRQRYDADPAIVGRLLDVKTAEYDRRRDAARLQLSRTTWTSWLRLQWDLTQHSRGAHFMEAIARLQPGVTPEQAARELAALSGRSARRPRRPTAAGSRARCRCSTTCSATTAPRSWCCWRRSVCSC